MIEPLPVAAAPAPRTRSEHGEDPGEDAPVVREDVDVGRASRGLEDQATALDDPETGDAVRSLNVPIGRWGEPEEVAALVAFLLGPEARWIHGSIYYIDGGNDAAIRPDRY